jgi:hypothetical protein
VTETARPRLRNFQQRAAGRAQYTQQRAAPERTVSIKSAAERFCFVFTMASQIHFKFKSFMKEFESVSFSGMVRGASLFL